MMQKFLILVLLCAPSWAQNTCPTGWSRYPGSYQPYINPYNFFSPDTGIGGYYQTQYFLSNDCLGLCQATTGCVAFSYKTPYYYLLSTSVYSYPSVQYVSAPGNNTFLIGNPAQSHSAPPFSRVYPGMNSDGTCQRGSYYMLSNASITNYFLTGSQISFSSFDQACAQCNFYQYCAGYTTVAGQCSIYKTGYSKFAQMDPTYVSCAINSFLNNGTVVDVTTYSDDECTEGATKKAVIFVEECTPYPDSPLFFKLDADMEKKEMVMRVYEDAVCSKLVKQADMLTAKEAGVSTESPKCFSASKMVHSGKGSFTLSATRERTEEEAAAGLFEPHEKA